MELKNAKEAKAWAADCDPTDRDRLQLLAAGPKPRSASAAANIRALALVAGPVALEVLGTYAHSRRGTFGDSFTDPVTKALLFAWPRFDGPSFAKTMFGAQESLRIANGGCTRTLEGIDAVALQRLVVAVAKGCSIAPLERCEALRILQIHFERGTDARPLARCGQLRILNISAGAKALDIDEVLRSVLPALTALRRLGVTCFQPGTLATLVELPALERVSVSLSAPPIGQRKDGPEPNAADIDALRELAKRGVEIKLASPQHWTNSAEEMFGDVATVARNGVLLGVTSHDPEPMLADMRNARFLFAPPAASLTSVPSGQPW